MQTAKTPARATGTPRPNRRNRTRTCSARLNRPQPSDNDPTQTPASVVEPHESRSPDPERGQALFSALSDDEVIALARFLASRERGRR